jgi:hypothetical protein
MPVQKEPYRVEYEVYQVKDKLNADVDEDWYEYVVTLMQGDSLIDRWDSRLETHNGVESQQLSEQRAEEVAQEIKEDVEENDNADFWFDLNN